MSDQAEMGNLARDAFKSAEYSAFNSVNGLLIAFPQTSDEPPTLIIIGSGNESYLKSQIKPFWRIDEPFPDYQVVNTEDKYIYSVPESVKAKIRAAETIKPIGDTRFLVDLADDEFLGYLETIHAWYKDDNFQHMIDGLRGITSQDYDRWQRNSSPAMQPDNRGYADKAARAFLLAAYLAHDIGGNTYRSLKDQIKQNLSSDQGHVQENFMLTVAQGKMPNIQSSAMARKAAKRLVKMHWYLERIQALGTDSLSDALCAPPEIREIHLSSVLKGSEENRTRLIIQLEVIRLLFVNLSQNLSQT